MRVGKVLGYAIALPLLFLATGLQRAQAQSLADALAAIEAGQFGQAMAMSQELDPISRDLVHWASFRAGNGTSSEARKFLALRGDWPGRDRIYATAERKMPPNLPPDTVIDFFGTRLPETGQGAVRLAEALTALGREDEAHAMLVRVWTGQSLSRSSTDAMLSAHGDLLSGHHEARTDSLLWRWRTTEAKRMLPLLDVGQRALAEARLALIAKSPDRQAKQDQVPAALKNAPGLLYDRYNLLADQGHRDDAIGILRRQSVSAQALGEPLRWSGWRRSLARWVMREGDPNIAYELASQHYLTPEDGFVWADLEWLAGYISLQKLNDPLRARRHFAAVASSASAIPEVARANYWLGRVAEKLSLADDATVAYRIAAEWPFTFYGMLAAEKLGRELPPDLGAATVAPDPAGLQNDLVRAGFHLLDAGERGLAVLFFADAGRILRPGEILSVGQALTSRNETFFALLLGKTALRRAIVLPELAYPLHSLAQMTLPVEPELAMAVARQESEFRADAGSGVGALGLMQLMPATAREVAGNLGLDYSKSRLTSDWRYNATLGSAYLAGLRQRFGNSPVMIAAGYNAGPGRPAAWMDDIGDPRIGEIDVIDWIEQIPFRETRNYVQRVTEAIPVYALRLGAPAGQLRFSAILHGEKLLVRPRVRPDRVKEIIATLIEPVAIAAEPEPEATLASPRLRPRGPSLSVRPRPRP